MDSEKQRELTNQNSEQDLGVDDPEDDVSVSNETDGGASLVTPPEYGEAGPPPSISSDREVESETGNQANVKIESAAGGVDRVTDTVDAWYAELAHPELARMLHKVPAALHQTNQTEALEIIFGPDDRVQIAHTMDYPWRCICALNILANDGSRWIGTGWFAGPRTIVTAGHCVYMHGHGGWVSAIQTIPGSNGETLGPYGSCNAKSFRSVKGWTQKQKRSYDYGAIILPSDTSLGELVGSFGYICLGDPDLQELMTNIAGYPGDKRPWPTLWFHARPISSTTSRIILYDTDTMPGQSGSPVWRFQNGQRHVVGIHTNGESTANSATRIVEPVFNNIKKWTEEAGG